MGSWLADRIMLLLAVIFGLVAAVLGIAFGALHSSYAALRDGDRVTGTVVRVEPHRSYLTVELAYPVRGEQRHTKVYPPTAEAAAFQPGAEVELLVSRRGTIPASALESKRPHAMLPIGGALAVLATLACVVLQLRLRHRPSAQRQALDVVIEAVARTRNLRLGGAMLFAVLAACFGLLPFADDTSTPGVVVGIEVLAAVTLAAAGWMAAVAFRLRDPARSPILDLIERRPHQLAWFYVRQETRRGITMHMVVMRRSDGGTETVVLPPADAEVVMGELARRAPHAARGFTPEHELRYRQNPAAWQPG